MQAINFLKEVEKIPNPVFLLNDVERITGKNREYSRTYIHRLKKRNLVCEVEKGKYSLNNDSLEISTSIISPSYISFISAYNLHSLTTQIPLNVQVVCAKSRKPLIIGESKIIFTKFKPKNIFGYKREPFRNKYIFIAEIEKAAIDSLYLPEYCPISDTFEAIKNMKIDKDKLIEYALRMDSIVTIKRLGYMLELNGVDIYENIKHLINNRYDLLNPFMKRSKNNSSKWKLNINEVFE